LTVFAGDKNPYPDSQIEGVLTTSACISSIPESVLNLEYLTRERVRIICEQSIGLNE